jgi:hypothetical protein
VTYKYAVNDNVINSRVLKCTDNTGRKRTIDNKTPMVIKEQIRPQNTETHISKGKEIALQYRVTIRDFSVVLWEKDLHPLQTYWFLSSKGEISFDYVGFYPEYEQWRKKTNNYFSTAAEVKAQKAKILKS